MNRCYWCELDYTIQIGSIVVNVLVKLYPRCLDALLGSASLTVMWTVSDFWSQLVLQKREVFPAHGEDEWYTEVLHLVCKVALTWNATEESWQLTYFTLSTMTIIFIGYRVSCLFERRRSEYLSHVRQFGELSLFPLKKRMSAELWCSISLAVFNTDKSLIQCINIRMSITSKFFVVS